MDGCAETTLLDGATARLTVWNRRKGPLFPMISVEPGDEARLVKELEAHGVNCELIESIAEEVKADPASLGRYIELR